MKGENWREALIAEVKPERFRYDESLASYTSFRIGGPADLLVEVNTRTELDKLVSYCEQTGIPWVFLGRGTNVLVDDAGFRGVALRFGPDFARITVDGVRLRAGAAAPLALVAETAARYSLSGLEFASGIPGSLGGGVYMNAGSYGGEMKDVVQKVTVLDESGTVISLDKEEMAFGYRTSIIQNSPKIVLEVDLLLEYGDYEESRATIAELARRRREKQPLEYPSAGSAFKRPVGYYAGKLIEDSGLKGMRVGDAQISEKHSGFIINLGHASAGDVIELIERVKQRVKERFGVDLQPELKIVGED